VDEHPDPNLRATVLRFGPNRALTAAEGAGAVVVLLAAIFTTDAAGRLLLIGVALILGAYAVTDLVFNPRILASAQGLRLHAPFARASLTWSQVDSIEADSRQRLGLRSSALEVDAGELLAQFSRRALGIDPAAAAAQLHAVAPPALSAGRRNGGSAQQSSAQQSSAQQSSAQQSSAQQSSAQQSEDGGAQPDGGDDQRGYPT
jgi:hypothetical protein